MNKFNVSIIIPNFNGASLLLKNLPKVLEAKKNTKNNILEIIVVDDFSTDNSLKVLKDNFPDVKIIKHKVNRGFSYAVNTGARSAKGDLLLLLNTDVLVDKNFLESIFENFHNEKVFAVSLHEKGYGASRGYFSDGVIQLGQYKERKETINTFFVSGGSGVFRKSVWNELSGMDEKLLSPFYWEDIDLCYRAQKRGYVCLWNADSNVTHNHESTVNKLSKKYTDNIRERNQLLMIWKNIHSKSLLRKHLVGIFKRVAKHIGYIKIVLMALLKIGPLLRSRAKEIRESKISDEAIFERYYE